MKVFYLVFIAVSIASTFAFEACQDGSNGSGSGAEVELIGFCFGSVEKML